MTKYSVPSFGGHIDFSDDVTIYPVLVMARTDKRQKGDITFIRFGLTIARMVPVFLLSPSRLHLFLSFTFRTH